MFNTAKKKLNTLIKTDRYKNSGYRLEKVNVAWGIKHLKSGKYVNLRVFDFCVPIIIPI